MWSFDEFLDKSNKLAIVCYGAKWPNIVQELENRHVKRDHQLHETLAEELPENKEKAIIYDYMDNHKLLCAQAKIIQDVGYTLLYPEDIFFYDPPDLSSFLNDLI